MGIISEFKQFAVKGNVIDLAVGIIIGAAFGKIVSSFVADVLMPPIGLALGKVNFADLSVILSKSTVEGVADVTLNYGKFIQTVVDFTIIAFSVFLLVKAINSLKKQEEAAPAAPPAPNPQEVLLTEIRDLLKK